MPISGKEMRKLFYKKGFELVPGAGKGSHWKLVKGNKTVVIPDHKELSKGLEHSLRKVLKQEKDV